MRRIALTLWLFLFSSGSFHQDEIQIPVFYSKATGKIRRWVLPSTVAESLLVNQKPGLGEDVIILSPKQYADEPTMQLLINQKTGFVPHDYQYAVIDPNTGIVEGSIIADPACGDAIPGKLLVASDIATVDWLYTGTTFIDMKPVTPPVNKQAGKR